MKKSGGMKSCGMTMKSYMPKGASMSPKGNIGAARQAEAKSAGGFKAPDAKNKLK